MILKTKPGLYISFGFMVALVVLSQLAFKRNRKPELQQNTEDLQKRTFYLPKVPGQMSFANEQVPLERWDVNEAFDRELIYGYNNAGHISYILKLSSRYFPIIEKQLKENGIPDDFKYLCVAESNLQNLVSRAGATGFWQFMSYSAPGFNLEVDTNVDDRYNIEKSTEAACRYFRQAYARFGSWTAAAASYNCGMGAYNQQATFQKTKYYYDLLLPEETNKYIFRILTFKYLMSNARQMGYEVTEETGYKPFITRSVMVSATIINLADWAISNGTNYRMLKILNPWMREHSLVVKPGKSYYVLLPQK